MWPITSKVSGTWSNFSSAVWSRKDIAPALFFKAHLHCQGRMTEPYCMAELEIVWQIPDMYDITGPLLSKLVLRSKYEKYYKGS